MTSEKRQLIRMIRDCAPQLKAADLASKSFEELAMMYRQLQGWD